MVYELPPTKDMLKQSPNSGLPSTDIVIAHLKYLSSQGWNSSTDLDAYMADVIMVYRFLETRIIHLDNRQILEDGKLWCNLNLDSIMTLSKEQFRISWTDAKGLRMALVEKAERMRFSASILNQFPNILNSIGLEVSNLKPDSMPVMRPPKQASTAEIEALWKLGYFCDLELNIRGERFRAHRLVLAAASGYWKRVLTGNEAGAGDLGVNHGCSKNTVLGVLRYVYTGRLPPGLQDGTGVFMEWLRLAREWDVVELRGVLENILLKTRGSAVTVVEKARFNTIS